MTKPSIRCSDLPRLLGCPGSRTLAERIKKPAKTGGRASWEGNWGHWSVAKRLMAEHDAVGPEGGLLGPEIPLDYQPSNFARWKANWCYDQVISTVDPDWALAVEQDCAFEFEHFILTGHPDIVAYRLERIEGEAEPQVIEIVGWDEKYGAIAVDPADVNDQMLGYAVLHVKQYPHLNRLTWKILQPNADEENGELRISEIVVDGRDKLEHAANYLEARLNAALKALNEIETGSHCRYCPAALQCPALRADMEDFMKMYLTPEQIAAIQPETPLARLAELYDANKKLSPVLEAGTEALKTRLESTEGKIATLPDGRTAKLKPRGGKRAITDKPKAEAILSALPDNLYFECLDFKPAAIEEALAEHNQCPVDGKKDITGKKLFAQQFAGIVVQASHNILVVG